MAGIHVLNFKDEIIDFISYKDNYVRSAKLTRNSEEKQIRLTSLLIVIELKI